MRIRRAVIAAAVMLLAWTLPGNAQLAQRFQHEGQLNYFHGVSSMRTGANGSDPCGVVATNSATSITVSGIPAGATVVAAYLYWAGSGSSDNTVTFAGTSTSGTMYTGSYTQGSTTFNFFSGRADVTSRISGNGTFSLSGLAVTNSGSYCTSEAVVKGWSLLVIYRHSSQSIRRLTVFDGLHVIRNASGSLNLGGFLAAPAQDSRIDLLVWEGDATISGGEAVTFNGTSLDASGDVFNSGTGHGVDLMTYDVSSLIDPNDRTANVGYVTANDLMLMQSVVTSISVSTVDVTPKGGTIQREAGTAYGQPFAVENTSLASDNFNLRATRSGSPQFLQIDSITGTGIVGTTVGDSVRATVPAQTTRTYTAWYTVPSGAAATNTLTLTARSVTYPGVPQATSAGFVDVQRLIAPDLTIAKTATAAFVQGTPATYRLVVRNSGSQSTSGTITVTDVLPAGLAYASSSAVRGAWSFSVAGQTVTATTTGTLVVGDSAIFTITTDISSAAVPSVTNVATVAGGGQLNQANDTARVTTAVTGIRDLTITKLSSAQFTVGATGQTYTLRVQNVGAIASTGTITVVDTLPAGITYVSRTGTNWTVSWNAGTRVITATNNNTVAANAFAQNLVLNVTVAGAAYPAVTNTAWVTGGGDANAANNSGSITTTVNAVDITVEKTSPALFTSGTNSTYTVQVRNVGTVASSGTITVRDTLPAGIGYVGLSGTGWTIGTTGTTPDGRVFGDILYSGTLAAGGSTTFTITVSVGASVGSSVTNRVHVTGGNDANPANNSSSVTTPVASPSLTIFTTVSPGGTVQPGTLLTFEVVFTNAGTAPAVDVIVHDDLPADVMFRIGSVTATMPGGITAVVQYSNGGAWTYSPVSGGCGAPAGFDGCVTAVRWVLQSPMPAGATGTGWIEGRIR